MKEMYSGKQVINAGEKFLGEEIFKNPPQLSAALDILSYWRFSHESALENALKILEETSLKFDKKAIFAKRLKRFASIVKKLRRFPEMKLKNMQDIGGGRAIIANPKKLQKVVRELRRRPEFKNGNGKIRYKDYISSPKEDGYRGYHLIGQFNNGLGGKRNIELQIRTRLQHDWATTLEIVDLFTGQALKSNQGEDCWKDFFSSVSKQFAAMEEIHLFDTLDIRKKFKEYSKVITIENKALFDSCVLAKSTAHNLNVVNKLEAYSNSLKILDGRISEESIDGYALIIVNTKKQTVTTSFFNKNENEDAEKEYVKQEKNAAESKDLVIALVSTTAVGGIKEAYPNYFADSTDFIQHLVCITTLELAKPRSLLSRIFG